MKEIALFETFAKGTSPIANTGKNAVIYTRVSSKEQFDTNQSLETQRKACYLYADKCGFTVQAFFGGTYESAKSDDRKEFTLMLEYVKKSKERISYIIVYSLERFSRNDNSIWLSTNLRKLGVEIISVTQPIDTSNPSGQMQQKILFLFSEFDNQLRRSKCMAGMKEMLLRGEWPAMPPFGYTIERTNGKRMLKANGHGKLLRLAFQWKAEGNLTNETIRLRLIEKGLKLPFQKLSAILKNPFYAGALSHSLLEGKIVEGTHERIVSQEVFLRVNGLLNANHNGYTINEENNRIPLKRFILCDTCGRALRGYLVHKKNLYYYKCNTIGCGNNKNANSLNHTFEETLSYFKLDATNELLQLIKEQTIATFNQLTKSHDDEYSALQQQLATLNKRIERLEERYVIEEIDNDLYNKYSDKFKIEKKELQDNIESASKRVSNLEECVEKAINFSVKLPSAWSEGDYLTKQQIQYLVFPEGIRYNKQNDQCRTTRVNSVFAQIAYLNQTFSNKKSGIPSLNLDYSALVARRERSQRSFSVEFPSQTLFFGLHRGEAKGETNALLVTHSSIFK